MSSSDDHPQNAKPVGRDGFVRVTDVLDVDGDDQVLLDTHRSYPFHQDLRCAARLGRR